MGEVHDDSRQDRLHPQGLCMLYGRLCDFYQGGLLAGAAESWAFVTGSKWLKDELSVVLITT